MHTKEELLTHLSENTSVLSNPLVRDAFEHIDRADFTAPEYASEAYEDYPLPIGHGQTISQPTTVAFMLEKLDPRPGQSILDVGTGSGWTTALLARVVGDEGRIRGVERIPELVEFGRNNLAKYDFKNAEIIEAGKRFGLPEYAPYDRIVVSASGDEIPDELLAQLKPGGVMVVPVGESILRIVKNSDGSIEKQEFPGFVFVPLVG